MWIMEPDTLFTADQRFKSLGLRDMTNEEYHAGPGLSCSGLKKFNKTPYHYYHAKMNPKPETSSQRLGTVAHMAVLEPERFELEVVAIEGNRNKTEVKEQIQDAINQGKKPCKPDELNSARKMRDTFYKSKTAQNLIKGGMAERSIFWRHPVTGVLLKCRPDYFRQDGIVVDVKTFNDLSDYGIQKQIDRMLYAWQSVHYLDGVNTLLGTKSTEFVHVFMEPETGLFRFKVLDDASLEKEREMMEPLYLEYSRCLRANEWPGYADEIEMINLPSFAWERTPKQIEEALPTGVKETFESLPVSPMSDEYTGEVDWTSDNTKGDPSED